jgi:hypothetical protein
MTHENGEYNNTLHSTYQTITIVYQTMYSFMYNLSYCDSQFTVLWWLPTWTIAYIHIPNLNIQHIYIQTSAVVSNPCNLCSYLTSETCRNIRGQLARWELANRKQKWCSSRPHIVVEVLFKNHGLLWSQRMSIAAPSITFTLINGQRGAWWVRWAWTWSRTAKTQWCCITPHYTQLHTPSVQCTDSPNRATRWPAYWVRPTAARIRDKTPRRVRVW